ncbi:DNA-binding protein RFX7 [Boleophthalmus pectinirostris]|uniref:DNA-binding protein RFX7 n=1 Tax=Boleophthalmus pectinirostris TaxID=150288 RepID=UPI00242F7E38|nr:DNA-binding protein RFX7 [Boleophthalmus pectinirostris]
MSETYETDSQLLQVGRGAASTPSIVPGLLPGLQSAEASALQIRIKNSICKSVQSKVEIILQDVEKFSDIEKLYLYLKLPSGPCNTSEKCDQATLSSSRTQQTHAFNWIRNHLEEFPETSLPKQEVYDEYKSFCDNLNYHPLSAADFGKMMKNVFPNMKARRLGMRGKSKYCYSGLRKRPVVHVPSLPSLDLNKPGEGLQCDILDSSAQMSGIKEEMRFAACDLVCEWAQKVLKRQFDAVEDLARFLVSSHYISNKSLAALTIMTETATERRTPQSMSAFVPAADMNTFQSQVTTLSPPSVDAKQQLQRKIQRKQQELKLHSPTPGEDPNQQETILCNDPTTPPQPPVGIMVATVPSPIMTQTCRPLISPSPAASMESKVLPLNFHMVNQSISKQSLKSSQNVVFSSAGSGRQRYPQILPKPLSTSAIALRSPSTMILAHSPMKTVMTTCHVSPVSLVKMTSISLAPNSHTATTCLTNATLRPASADISSPAEECRPIQKTMRSASTVPILAPVTMQQQAVADSNNIDVEMEVEAIHESSQRRFAYPCREAKQRAASVPIPQTKKLFGVDEMAFSNCHEKPSLSTVTVANLTKSKNNPDLATFSPHNTSPSSSMKISLTQSPGGSRNISFIKGNVTSTKNIRKRPGFSPDSCKISPSKRFFVPKQMLEGSTDPESGIRATLTNSHESPTRPESAPASREVEIKMNSNMTSQSYTHASSLRSNSFYSLANTESSMQRKNTLVMDGITSPNHVLLQQHQIHNVSKPASNISVSNSNESIDGSQTIYPLQTHSATENVHFFNQDISTNSATVQPDIDYFSFDDDVTQDSIVEELVQMEEQMKLNLKDFGNCHSLQCQQPGIQENMTATYQNMNPCYPNTNNHCNPIQTPTPTPTPTPTTEMIGGAQVLTGDSPCSRMASTTPVDSALGSSRHTPVGTPLSNCSSTVPPSPVECRNPFAFTPINSSNTAFHDNINVTSSPVKPMQRPMATHPDKTRLEWMNNSYNNSSSSVTKSNSGMGIVPSYQGLIDNHFQKPHAFAVPHARHQENTFGRLTPISPVQQQVASMANMSKQEGFAVPAPLDNKANAHSTSFRCRSVSPAVHQRNVSVSIGSSAISNTPRSVLSPFNSPITPEIFNLFSNNQSNIAVSCMAQRSRSVPLNVMMQTQEMPPQGQPSSTKHLGTVLLNKLERSHDDTMRGLGMNNLPSSYSACMNLSQILESDPNISCSDHHLLSSNSSQNTVNEPTIFDSIKSNLQLTRAQSQQQIPATAMQDNFRCTVPDLVPQNRLSASSAEQNLNTGANFPHELRMTSDLSSSINDLNTLDTNLLFDPDHQQGQYLSETPEELVHTSVYQQITSDSTHSGGLEWFESKDHSAVGLMG